MKALKTFTEVSEVLLLTAALSFLWSAQDFTRSDHKRRSGDSQSLN